MVIFGPFFFGGLYSNGPALGMTRAPFLASACVVALAELVHQASKAKLIEGKKQIAAKAK